MEILNQLAEALADAVLDSLIIIPFMLAAYLAIGLLERGGGGFMLRAVSGAGRVGPLIGGLLGVAPTCGFSAAAANLFGAGIISAGTLAAVFLSTSDEMLAVMLSERTDIFLILKILAVKAGCAVLGGFALDLVYAAFRRRGSVKSGGRASCAEGEVCGCGDSCCAVRGSLFASAVKRTLRVILFIIIVSFGINIAFIFVDVEAAAAFVARVPAVGELLGGLIGLVPNCAVSVAVTQLYLKEIITAPVMLTALLAGAGSGFLVLFRANKSLKENLLFCLAVYILSVVLGSVAGYLLF